MDIKRIWIFSIIISYLIIFTGQSIAAENKEPVQLDIAVTRPVVNFISGVIYSQPSSYNYKNWPLKMDIIQPESKELLPAVVFVPGGGFIASNKDKLYQEKFDIANAGYVVASIEYRVAPQSVFPRPLEDVKSAIRYLRANASKYGIDPNRIAVMGSSAGGYLAALTGTTNGLAEFDKGDYLEQSSSVKAVVDLYGVSDLTEIGHDYSQEIKDLHKSPSAPEGIWIHGLAVNGPGGSITDDPEKAAKANPIHYITNDVPPFLIMVGDKDTRVSPYESKLLYKALTKTGKDVDFYIIKGANHGGPKWVQQGVTQIIIKFLNEHVRGNDPLSKNSQFGTNIEKD